MLKHVVQRLAAFALSAVLLIGAAVPAYATNPEDDITMGSLEEELLSYLAENYPEVEYGTAEFIEYIMGVLVEDDDPTLAAFPNYEYIKYFCGEYMGQLDYYQTTPDYYQATIEGPLEKFIPSVEFLAKTVSERKAEVAQQDLLDERLYAAMKSTREANAAAINFDVDAATTYALNHAENYNKQYNTYASDCTNFVSQALHAGGLDMRKPSNPPLGIMDTSTYWYSIKYQDYHGNTPVWKWRESSSWLRVVDLYSYCTIKSAELASFTNIDDLIDNVKVGDVVQLRNSKGVWYHSIIVTGQDDNGEFKYCGHTKNRYDEPLRNAAGADRYRFIRFS